MHGRPDGRHQKHGLTGGQTDTPTDSRVYGRPYGHTDRVTQGSTDGQRDTLLGRLAEQGTGSCANVAWGKHSQRRHLQLCTRTGRSWLVPGSGVRTMPARIQSAEMARDAKADCV
jgi:hypothetical protein